MFDLHSQKISKEKKQQKKTFQCKNTANNP